MKVKVYKIKKLLGILILSLLFGGSAFSDNIITYKCKFDRKNYEYIINWHTNEINDIILLNRSSKDYYYTDVMKGSVDVTVINGEDSYNFKGFKNNRSHLEHYLVFLDGSNFLYAYIQASKFDTGRAVDWEITSFDNAIDKVTKGNCKEFK